jgi:uncharacterized protein
MAKSAPDASNPRAANAGLASPCLSVCRMSNPLTWREGVDLKLKPHVGASYCVGCARTLEEIAWWADAPDDAKRRVLSHLPERRYALRQLENP